MTTTDRLLAILKEPDRYGVETSITHNSLVYETSSGKGRQSVSEWISFDEANALCADMNTRHRLKRLCEEIAQMCSERAKQWAESNGDGSKEWEQRALISAAEADRRCAAAIRHKDSLYHPEYRACRVILALADCVSDEMIEAFDIAVAEWNHPGLEEAKRAGIRAALRHLAGDSP